MLSTLYFKKRKFQNSISSGVDTAGEKEVLERKSNTSGKRTPTESFW